MGLDTFLEERGNKRITNLDEFKEGMLVGIPDDCFIRVYDVINPVVLDQPYSLLFNYSYSAQFQFNRKSLQQDEYALDSVVFLNFVVDQEQHAHYLQGNLSDMDRLLFTKSKQQVFWKNMLERSSDVDSYFLMDKKLNEYIKNALDFRVGFFKKEYNFLRRSGRRALAKREIAYPLPLF